MHPSIHRSAGLPLVEELSPPPDVMRALRAFADEPNVLLLESTLCRQDVGRYSFLAADPFDFVKIAEPVFGSDPFVGIHDRMHGMECEVVAGLPPFQGGAAGLLSYELGGVWEKLPVPAWNEFQLPVLAVGLYDWVIAWDHQTGRSWIISHGFPEMETSGRTDRAAQRIGWVKQILKNSTPDKAAPNPSSVLPAHRLVRQFPLAGMNGVTSNFSHDDYLLAVERVIEYVHAGDIFQTNLSQRLLARAVDDPLSLYERLRTRNPAPFAGYFAHDDWVVASASPERFVAARDGEVETRPIKGTRKRNPAPEADLFTRDELRESEKDQAENVMIVDLLRNDLSRVCRPNSIRVPELCTVETYETVQHLVSEIRGNLAENVDAWDLLRAVFPGGSITGAPKVRAMEIIADLEPTVRGPYCGSFFYMGFDGSADSNILIRTFTSRRGWVQFPVGGGIVAQSDPEAEFQETLHKAEGMLRALK